MSSPSRLRQKDILKDLDQIYRAAISQQSCKVLLKLLQDTDISYLDLFISMASNYFQHIFLFWRKYQSKISSYLSAFMNLLYSKVHYTKNIELNILFNNLKHNYLKNTKNKLVLLQESEMKLYRTGTETKLRQYTQAQINQKGGVKQINLVHNQQQQASPMIKTHNEFGLQEGNRNVSNEKNLQSRVQILKELWVKTDLYFQIIQKKQNDKNLQKSGQQTQNHKKNRNKVQLDKTILKSLQERQRVQKDCSCCISFVYEDQDLTFPSFKEPVSFFGSVHQIDRMEKQIMKKIISYLNGNGGSLFIGTKKDGHKIFPNPQVIAQIHKEQQTNRFQSYFKYVNPSLTLNKQITLSFLPIAQSPRSHPQNSGLIWKKGFYILRISVFPTLPHKVYYYLPQKKELAQICKTTEDGEEQLVFEQIYDFMRERYNQYNPNKSSEKNPLREIGNIHPILIRHFGFCQVPQIGEPFYGQLKLYEQIQKKEEDEKFKVNPLLKDAESFKNISLLVVNRSAVDFVQNIFSIKEKLNSKIIQAFKKDNFRLSNNTFLVFHDCKYQKLKNGLTNHKAELKEKNEKKQVILISTLPYVSYLQERLTEEQQLQCVSKAKMASKQNIQIVKISGVIYFKCVSTITAVYIYFYIYHHFTIKGAFQKIPQNTTALSKHHLKNQNKNNKAANTNFPKNRQNYSKGNHYESSRDYKTDDYYQDQYEQQYKNVNYDKRYEQKKQVQASYDFTKDTPAEINHTQYPQDIYLVNRVFDEYGNRWDYYSNLIAYCYNINGQCINYQYYNLQ